MEPTTAQILAAIAAGYFTHYSTQAIGKLFRAAFRVKPGLEKCLRSAQTTEDIEAIFRQVVGIIDANAGAGSIEIDDSALEAMRSIHFDHASGRVTVHGSTISAPVLWTGGGAGATGESDFGDGTELRSKGTAIKIGKGALIRIKGNARIKQN